MRNLASIQRIDDIQPIDGADMVEVCTINGWKVVAQKGLYVIGDLVIYIEIDSFLPINPEYEFLRASSFKRMGSLEGFRIRTKKIRGQLSQGLILDANSVQIEFYEYIEGTDVTEELGIIKYERPISSQLQGIAKGDFPSFLHKTDEERIQNLPQYFENYRGREFYVTEKLDGSSFTAYLNNGVFGVCSRNLELVETEGNKYWQAAKQLDLERKLREVFPMSIGGFCLQGELVGEGIQGNPYKLKGQTVYFFNVFMIKNGERTNGRFAMKFIESLDLKFAPVLKYSVFDTNMEDILKDAEGKSVLNKDTEREGLVYRLLDDPAVSFKVISNKFLLKEKD